MLTCLILFSMVENVNNVSRDSKMELRYQSDQTYEALHLICYILISLTQFSMLETEQWLTKDLVNKKASYLTTVIKLMKYFL